MFLRTLLFWILLPLFHNMPQFWVLSEWNAVPLCKNNVSFLNPFIIFWTHCCGKGTLVSYLYANVLKVGVSDLIDQLDAVYKTARFHWLSPL